MKKDWMYWVRLLSVGIIGGFIIVIIGWEILYLNLMTKAAPSKVCCVTPMDLGIEYEEITLFNEVDDIRLSGWYIPSRNRAAVIVLQGYGGNRTGVMTQIEIFARHGFGVLAYDLRAHGESEGEYRTFGWEDDSDVGLAVNFLLEREDVDSKRIGIYGFSVGGQIAIRAAVRFEEISAVFADDPSIVSFTDIPTPSNNVEKFFIIVNKIDTRGIDIWTGASVPAGVAELIPQISPRPIFLIATGEGREQKTIQYFYELAGQPKEIWVIPDTVHGGSWVDHSQEFEEHVITFFTKTLLRN